MTDRVTFTFGNNEHDIYLYYKQTPNANRMLKDYLKSLMNGTAAEVVQSDEQEPATISQERIADIAGLTLCDDIEAWGGVGAFLAGNPADIIKTRIRNLRTLHPDEADEVIHHIKRVYPTIGAMIS